MLPKKRTQTIGKKRVVKRGNRVVTKMVTVVFPEIGKLGGFTVHDIVPKTR